MCWPFIYCLTASNLPSNYICHHSVIVWLTMQTGSSLVSCHLIISIQKEIQPLLLYLANRYRGD